MKLKQRNQRNISETKTQFFIKINEITNIENKRGGVSIDPADIKRKIREQYEKLYANEFDSLDKMDQFPKKHKLNKI